MTIELQEEDSGFDKYMGWLNGYLGVRKKYPAHEAYLLAKRSAINQARVRSALELLHTADARDADKSEAETSEVDGGEPGGGGALAGGGPAAAPSAAGSAAPKPCTAPKTKKSTQ